MANVAALDGFRKMDLLVYGGSALMLASNFRDRTDDIDALIRVDDPAPPERNRELVKQSMYLMNLAGIVKPSAGNGNGKRWLDVGVRMIFEGSNVNLAERQHHIYLQTFSAESPIFDVYVPDKSLMLAMKTKAMRITEDNPSGKPKDLNDLQHLLTLHPEIKNGAELVAFSATFFPEIREQERVIHGANVLFERRLLGHGGRPDPSFTPTYAGGSCPEP